MKIFAGVLIQFKNLYAGEFADKICERSDRRRHATSRLFYALCSGAPNNKKQAVATVAKRCVIRWVQLPGTSQLESAMAVAQIT
jgi:hypothetical protein